MFQGFCSVIIIWKWMKTLELVPGKNSDPDSFPSKVTPAYLLEWEKIGPIRFGFFPLLLAKVPQ
jgi:hypothetical protein